MNTRLAQWSLLLSVTSTCLFLAGTTAQTLQFAPPSAGETFRNLISAHSHLLLGSTTAIYRLNDALTIQQTKALGSSNRMLVADFVGSFKNNILSCDSQICFLAELEDFNSVSWQTASILRDDQNNAVGVLAPRANGTSDLTYGERAIVNGARLLAKGALVNAGTSNTPYSFLQYAIREEANRFDPLLYLTEFPVRYANDSGFVFFVTRPTDGEIRIVRFCDDDPGVLGSFASHFEAVLHCGDSSASFAGDSTAATFVNVTTTFNGRPTILVVQTRIVGMDSKQLEVCSFDLGQINFLMTQKFEDCINGRNNAMAGFIRNVQAPCIAVPAERRPFVGECPLPGAARPGLEVSTPYVQEPFSTLPVNSVTISLTHTTLDGSLFLFAATTSGQLLQFHISNPSQSTYIRTVNLPITLVENVTEMVASDSGEYIFAMTPSKIFRHSVDMCSSFTTCSECLTSSDPICGWCPLRGSCTRRSNCPSVAPVPDPIWLTDSSTCPVISTISPSVVYIPQLTQETVRFTMTTTNIASTSLTSYNYQCQFHFQNALNADVVSTSASRTNGQFMCDSPPSSRVPELADGQDTLDTVVSLVLADSSISIASLEMFFPFTDCAVHEGCTSCIGDNRCEWCPFSFQCVQPGTSCVGGASEPTISSGEVCPQIFPSSVTGEYLIHTDHTYQEEPLRINSSDLERFRNDFNNNMFKCKICAQSDESCDTPLFSSPASLAQSGNEVLCQQMRYDAVDDSPALSARLRIVWNELRTIDNPNNASVILYSCPLLGTNCGQCLAQEPRYECSYCYNSMDGSCLLKVTCPTEGGSHQSSMSPSDVGICPDPQILEFEPTAGPTKGGTVVTINGTNLGASRGDVDRVMIDGVSCNVTGYVPGISITCVTGVKGDSITSDIVSVYFNHFGNRVDSQETFMFVTPFLNNPPAEPNRGPRSGGTNITIQGTNIGVGSTHRVLVGQRECTVKEVRLHSIVCATPPSNSTTEDVQLVQLSVDGWTSELSGFTYVEDPSFASIEPLIIFQAGGMNYTVKGDKLMSVKEPRLLVYYEEGVASPSRRRRQTNVALERRFVSEACSFNGDKEMICTAPSLSTINFNQSAGSRQLRIGLLMDGVSSLLILQNISFTLFPDPTFERFEEERVFTAGDAITLTIQGSGFNFREGQVRVHIDPCESTEPEICLCSVDSVTNNTLTCTIDIISQRELQNSPQPLTVTVAVGNQMDVIGTIRIQSGIQIEILYYLIPVFAAVIVVATVIFIVLVAVFCRKARQKDRKYDQLILELEKLESSVARECKIGFAELQTDLDELTGDVVGCRLPYRDLQSYLLTSLFPGASTHPTLQPLQIPSHRKPLMERTLRDFNTLLNDKRTLLTFIRSMEEQRGFTIRDKSIVGSLLIVALHNKLDYATDVLKSLLSELIRKTVQQSQPKLLLRRTESVAEKMLTNWLAFCLHGYVMEHVGQPMYLLYRAVKNQLEKGPIDVITGEARYSLSEQKLIRQKVDIVVLDATVETEDGLRVPVKLLDCDTISQAKEKMLDAVFKAAPVSQRPSLTHVDLEYIKSPNERSILRDEDSSNVKEGDWKKINTLKHYWVKDGALLRLIPRRDYAPPGRTYDYPGSLISTHTMRQRALSEAEDGTRVWHLFKQLDTEDPKRSPFMNKKLVSEIYLPRMLSTKSILQKFADDLFHSLFSISHPPSSPTSAYMTVFPNSPGVQVPMGYAPGADAVPMAVKYLFDFLDDEAEAAKIVDTDVVHTWKNNALSLRFWVNLIKNPEFVFDINKSHTVDACLSVIAQAFIDGCSSSDMKLTIDSPTSKLLYNKEVQGYKAEVKRYYDDVNHLPRIPEDAMQYYLRQLSNYQSQQMRRSGGFVVDSALHDLLRYADKYHEPFLRNLRGAGLESKAQLFEGVLKGFSN